LIVCEGAKTEPNYFKNFRVPKTVIDVKGVGENPTRLVQSAIKLKAEAVEADEEYDQVWCVFDRDDWPPQDFNSAIHKAESHDLQVAYSNEAFELWYVLHFEFLNTGIPRDNYCKKMTKLLGKKYQKNSDTIYDELRNRQVTAIRNAEKLLASYNPSNPGQDNPSTTVHLLVKELIQSEKSPK
jgi:hypothetical protein